MRLLAIGLIALLGLAACSSEETNATTAGDDATVSEVQEASWQDEYETRFRAVLDANTPTQALAACNQVDGLSQEQLAEQLIAITATGQQLSTDGEPVGTFAELVADGLVEDTVSNATEAANLAAQTQISFCDEIS